MISEKDKLGLLLGHMDAEVIGITPGTDPNATSEDRARAIRKCLIEFRRNPESFEEVDLNI